MSKQDLIDIIGKNKQTASKDLLDTALSVKESHYGKGVFLRGLIEFSNYCTSNCYYCGIRCANANVKRYRLDKSEILSCCKNGYELGFRTFVLQSGEDLYYTDSIMCEIIYEIKRMYSDCAVTLSLGEKSKETYKEYRFAGADRYLLRHETANPEHYKQLHPKELSLENRKQSLYYLKEIGFQVGAGFMVGSPFQTVENLAEDLIFIKELQPHMVGIGPFIPHKDTPFAGYPQGPLNLALTMIALTRMLLPKSLLPATTALGSIDPSGREKGLKAGANVVMPNLSPQKNRKNYVLYNDKISTGEEAAEGKAKLEKKVEAAGFFIDYSRGDCLL